VLDLLSGFVTELRRSGLPVSLTEHLDAAEAVKHIPLEDREALKYALAATLVKSSSHWRAFETAFEVYFAVRTGGHGGAEGEDETLEGEAVSALPVPVLEPPGKTSNAESCAAVQPVLPVKLSCTYWALVPDGRLIVTVLPVDGLKVYVAELTSVL